MTQAWNEGGPRLDFDAVRRAADGRWDQILARLAPNTLSAALAKPGKKVDCPLPRHGGKKDFRLYKDFADNGAAVCSCEHWRGGFELLDTIHGWGIKTTMEEVATALWGESRVIDVPVKPARRTRSARQDREIERAQALIWDETWSLADPRAQAARVYFKSRGIYWKSLAGLDAVLRFHPGLKFVDDNDVTQGHWPAIVAAMTSPAGDRVTLHRIYLDQASRYTGKAKAKKMYPLPDRKTLEGAAIRLGPARPIIGIAEGIETALAVRQATGLSVWPCFNDWGVAYFEPPDGMRGIIAFADRDASGAGLRAAQSLRTRQADKITVKVFIPGGEGEKCDFNDVLMTHGREGFADVFNYLGACKARFKQRRRKDRYESQAAGL